MPLLFSMYGLGFAAVFLVLALLYQHAYRQRRDLGLNSVERCDTLETLFSAYALSGIGLACVLVANLGQAAAVWAWPPLMLIGPVMGVIGGVMGRRRRAALAGR